jgi:hypothetical protein
MTNEERKAIRKRNKAILAAKVPVRELPRVTGAPRDLRTGRPVTEFRKLPGLLIRQAMTDRTEQGFDPKGI